MVRGVPIVEGIVGTAADPPVYIVNVSVAPCPIPIDPRSTELADVAVELSAPLTTLMEALAPKAHATLAAIFPIPMTDNPEELVAPESWPKLVAPHIPCFWAFN
jgi:hypothetical protein